MNSEKVELARLVREDEFDVSLPPDPSLHETFISRFPGIPPIVTDPGMVILSGHNSYEFFIRNGHEYCDILVSPLGRKDALFLSYNSRSVLKPLSLYEKLRFLTIILRYAEIQEIYQRTAIGIRIDDTLTLFLPELTGDSFRELLSGDRISLRTAVRLCSFEKDDRDAFIRLFTDVRFSASNELKVLDICGEICFRDKCGMDDLLRQIGYDTVLQSDDAAAGILSAISKLRYPAYSSHEKNWNESIGEIKFPFRHNVHHAPFFEKKEIELRLYLDSIDKLKEISRKLKS